MRCVSRFRSELYVTSSEDSWFAHQKKGLRMEHWLKAFGLWFLLMLAEIFHGL